LPRRSSRQAIVRAAGRPRATSAAKVGQALLHDLGHQQAAGVLDALGANHQRLARADIWSEFVRHGAHVLRRADEEDGIGRCACGQALRRAQLAVQRHAGQERAVDVAVVDVGDRFGLTRPQRDGAAGLDQGLRQRRAPGSGADDGNAIEGGGHPAFSCGWQDRRGS
jgi:hypothetical protein